MGKLREPLMVCRRILHPVETVGAIEALKGLRAFRRSCLAIIRHDRHIRKDENFMKISAQLRLGACSAAVGIALIATPSFAQATSGTEDQGADATDDDTPVIVVTGSILNRENIITASPVTVISAVTLEERGLNTAADAVQRLSRSEERRVGKECVSTCRSRWSPYN